MLMLLGQKLCHAILQTLGLVPFGALGHVRFIQERISYNLHKAARPPLVRAHCDIGNYWVFCELRLFDVVYRVFLVLPLGLAWLARLRVVLQPCAFSFKPACGALLWVCGCIIAFPRVDPAISRFGCCQYHAYIHHQTVVVHLIV